MLPRSLWGPRRGCHRGLLFRGKWNPQAKQMLTQILAWWVAWASCSFWLWVVSKSTPMLANAIAQSNSSASIEVGVCKTLALGLSQSIHVGFGL